MVRAKFTTPQPQIRVFIKLGDSRQEVGTVEVALRNTPKKGLDKKEGDDKREVARPERKLKFEEDDKAAVPDAGNSVYLSDISDAGSIDCGGESTISTKVSDPCPDGIHFPLWGFPNEVQHIKITKKTYCIDAVLKGYQSPQDGYQCVTFASLTKQEDGSPGAAERAGIKVGDILATVDGTNVSNKNLEFVGKLFRSSGLDACVHVSVIRLPGGDGDRATSSPRKRQNISNGKKLGIESSFDLSKEVRGVKRHRAMDKVMQYYRDACTNTEDLRPWPPLGDDELDDCNDEDDEEPIVIPNKKPRALAKIRAYIKQSNKEAKHANRFIRPPPLRTIGSMGKQSNPWNLCTCCGKQEVALEQQTIHPLFGTMVCKGCAKRYNTHVWTVDEDGKEESCRWCCDGGDLYMCDFCIKTICRICLGTIRYYYNSVFNGVKYSTR